MNPAFDINRLRSFLALFQRSAIMVRGKRSHNDISNSSTCTQLAERWKKELSTNSNKTNGDQTVIDVTTWISRLMLDNIGEGKFGDFEESHISDMA